MLLPVKVALGPLSGALALLYLGIWLGRVFEDRLLFAAVVMIAWTVFVPSAPAQQLIAASGIVNLVSVVLALVVAFRGSALGDMLARWPCSAT